MSIKGFKEGQQDEKRNQHAIGLLEDPISYPGLPTYKGCTIRVRVWAYPAFAPYRAYAVLNHRAGLAVRRIVWDRAGDFERISVEPNTFGCESCLPEEIWLVQQNQLLEIVLPPFINSDSAGLDGVRYGIEFNDFMGSARLQWWMNGPDKWSPLHKWATETMGIFDTFLPASTVALKP